MYKSFGVNYAANLPAYDSKELQRLFGTTVSDYVIQTYKRTLNLHLILQIDSTVELCKDITYLCEDDSGIADMSDTAIDGPLKERFLQMPKIKTFHGFKKGGFRYKLAVEQLECIWQQEILRNWFNTQLAQAIENGRQAIMARWYRELFKSAHPKNSGNNAGMLYGGNVLGTPSNPVKFDKDNADLFFTSVLSTIKQMPRTASPTGEYGRGIEEDAFIFGPSIMEDVLLQTEKYMKYDWTHCDCVQCSLFKDVFTCHPRGILPITGDCIESYSCVSGGESHRVFPILFGRRYKGAKASLAVKSHDWVSDDGFSVFYQTVFYHHMYVYDCRFFGVAYITIKTEQPETVPSCDTNAVAP